MDTELIGKLADSAQARAERCHNDYKEYLLINAEVAKSRLNDYFYWIGHANAYRGIIAMIELQTVVEDERDAEPTCP